jgi:hypothetical protein
MHWFIMHSIMTNPALLKDAKGGPPPTEIFAIFKWFYLFMGTMLCGAGLGNFLSGFCIIRRRARLFSMIVAGINCVGFPIGTTLGVFSFVVLLRESVVEVYAATSQSTPSAG